ncbi:MAG: YggT family protein [Candidatus Syntrophosphaera sp.]|nr:YggT family protein [Candidatus Syntrophosphaera sp.]
MPLIIEFLVRLLQLYNILILVRVLMSWFVQNPYNNKLYIWLIRATEPVLGPIRRIMPRMGLDFSPVVAMLLIQIIARLLISTV